MIDRIAFTTDVAAGGNEAFQHFFLHPLHMLRRKHTGPHGFAKAVLGSVRFCVWGNHIVQRSTDKCLIKLNCLQDDSIRNLNCLNSSQAKK